MRRITVSGQFRHDRIRFARTDFQYRAQISIQLIVVGGWMFNLFGGTGMTGFDIGSVYSAGAAVIGAIILLALYHAFFRRRML